MEISGLNLCRLMLGGGLNEVTRTLLWLGEMKCLFLKQERMRQTFRKLCRILCQWSGYINIP